jgi:CRP-like cAMP-binding protein
MVRDILTDDLLIEQGEPAMEAYLILGGRAEIILNDVKIADVGEGDIVGEAALFKGSNYGASVRAATPLSVQPITPDILDEKIRGCDPMLRALIRMMMVRLRKTNAELAGSRP